MISPIWWYGDTYAEIKVKTTSEYAGGVFLGFTMICRNNSHLGQGSLFDKTSSEL